MSVAITIESAELSALQLRVRKLAAGLGDVEPLLESLGAEIESQSRRRISEEKRAPDGEPWQPWSDAYKRTRHRGQSLLEGEGHLVDSIRSAVSGDLLETGSPLVYAAIQQLGGTADMARGPAGIPARPWLGISAENAADLDAVIDAWLSDAAAEALA